jgi:hypothetical protein
MGNKRNTSEYYGDESSMEDILTNTSINEEKPMDTEEIEKLIEEFSLDDSESKYSSESDLYVEQPDELINSYYNPEYIYYPSMESASEEEEDIDYVKKIEELVDDDLFSETDTEEYDSERGEREREVWESFIKKYSSKKKEKDELSVETIPIKENTPMSISPIEERIEKQLKKLKLDSPVKDIIIRIPRRDKKKNIINN